MKSILKKLSVLFSVILLAASFVGCSAGEKTFSKAGVSITLTEKFVEKEYITQTCYYESPDMLVMVLKEEFDVFPGVGDWSVEQYTTTTIQVNGLKVEYEMSDEGYAYFEYEKTLSGNDYKYLATCHKSDDAFWLIQFASFTKNYDDLKADMFNYANSITFVTQSASESVEKV